MHISFTFKNFEPSEHLRKYARRRMEKLGRFFGKNPALDAQVNMAVDKFRQRVEVQLTGDGINIAARMAMIAITTKSSIRVKVLNLRMEESGKWNENTE